jgi:hypothetical protein
VLRGIYSCNSFKPLGLPLGVKARVNELNSLGIGRRHGIGLFFRLNIVASKEYRLTIIV